MSQGGVLAAKAIAGAGLTGLAVLVWRTRWADGLTPARTASWLVGGLLATRLGLFVGLFWLAGVPASSDVAGYYHPQATAVLAGQVPYRDFPTSYGLAFPYLAALPVALWDAPESLVLFAIALELLSAPLWLAIGRRLGGDAIARRAALLYVLSPVPLINVAVNGQNQVWVAAGLAVATWCLLERREVLSGLALGAVGGGLKLLAFLFAPALALGARRPLAWVAACLAVPLALLGAGGLGSLDVLLPVRLEAPLHSSGNVPFVLGLLGVDLAAPAVQGVLSAALVAALGATALGIRSRRDEGSLRVAHALALLLLTFLLASRKSYTSYLVTGFFPLCLSVAAPGLSTRTVALFGALGTAAVVEPSAWFRWVERRAPGELLAQAPAGGRLAVAAFLLVEGVLLAGYLRLLVWTWRAFRCGDEVASPAARAVAW